MEQTAKKIICLTLAGTHICRGFKVHDLITCESKFKVLFSLGVRRRSYFENEGLTLKMYQMFSVHTTPEEFKNATNHRLFWICT